MHTDNVGMLHLGSCPSFPQELLCLHAIQLPGSRNLDRYNAVKISIACLPHAAELPGADLVQQLELGDSAWLAMVTGSGLGTDQLKVAAAGRTLDIGERVVGHDLNGVVAVGAATVHGWTRPQNETVFLSATECTAPQFVSKRFR